MAADLGTRLFLRLPAKGHELVVFDVNRNALLSSLIAPGPKRAPDGLALPLGRGAPSGEAGALVIPLGQLVRVRSNPF